MVSKQQLRKQFLPLWQQWLSAGDSAFLQRLLIERLAAFLKSQSGAWGLYRPLHRQQSEEMDLSALEILCPHLEWVYPKVLSAQDGENRMAFFPADQGFLVTSWGMVEPVTDGTANAILPEGLIVPGLAFDRKGFRLGRGKGFYDAFLAKAKSIKAVGVTPSSFLVTELPSESWDQRMSGIVTEKEDLWFQQ